MPVNRGFFIEAVFDLDAQAVALASRAPSPLNLRIGLYSFKSPDTSFLLLKVSDEVKVTRTKLN